ncbi:MAG TPA: collagen-binding domain-containing protein [Verrucomicrobiae bacterium]|jgi:hypothetical protein
MRLGKYMGALLGLAIIGSACAAEFKQWGVGEGRTGRRFVFLLRCESWADYLVQRSTNLVDWETIGLSHGFETNRLFASTNSIAAMPHAFFRTVRTDANFFGYAVVAKELISLGTNSTVTIDSFDSSNPLYSTNGFYEPTKRKDTALVATLSSNTPAIETGLGRIYGHAVTAPGGTVTGNIGNAAWHVINTGIQPGTVFHDFSTNLADVVLPTNATNWATPLQSDGTYILTTGDYKINGDFTARMQVVGNARLWIAGRVRMGAGDYINIAGNGSLRMYVGGGAVPSDAFFSGNVMINTPGKAANCSIFGLTNCTEIKFYGAADFTGVIYAPNAVVSVGPTSEIVGAITAKSVSCVGVSGLHYDEALGH